MSDANPPETNQPKRKLLSDSPDPDENENGNAPNKRTRLGDDTPGRNIEPDERPGRNGNGTAEDGNGEQQEPADQGAPLKQEGRSPDTRRAAQQVDIPSSPEKQRRPSEPRRQDDRSPTGPPDRRPSGARRASDARFPADRRDSESGRRTSSFATEKEHDRRESFSQEEKKRGRRLFGGLLSTLSQTTTNSQQKKRLEIEKRQQEKAAQQTREDDKRRSEKLAVLERVRKIEQVRFDEQVVSVEGAGLWSMMINRKPSR